MVDRKLRYTAADSLVHPWLLSYADPKASEQEVNLRRERLKHQLKQDREAGKLEPRRLKDAPPLEWGVE